VRSLAMKTGVTTGPQDMQSIQAWKKPLSAMTSRLKKKSLTMHLFAAVMVGLSFGTLSTAWGGASDPVTISASAGADYGRLTFDWPQEVDFAVTLSGRTLNIDFARPLSGDLTGAVSMMRDYASGVKLIGGNRRVRVNLTGDFSIRADRNGGTVDVDILKDRMAGSGQIVMGVVPPIKLHTAQKAKAKTKPKQKAKAKAKPKRKKQQAKRQSRPKSSYSGGIAKVRIRVGEHKDHSRLVFDWPFRVDYVVHRQSNAAIALTFRKPARLDDRQIHRLRPKHLLSFDPREGQTATAVGLTTYPGGQIKVTRVGNRIVVDLYGGRHVGRQLTQSSPPQSFPPASLQRVSHKHAPNRADPLALKSAPRRTQTAQQMSPKTPLQERTITPSPQPPGQAVEGLSHSDSFAPSSEGQEDIQGASASSTEYKAARSSGFYGVARLGGGLGTATDLSGGNGLAGLITGGDDDGPIASASMGGGFDFGNIGAPVRAEAEYSYRTGLTITGDATTNTGATTSYEGDLTNHAMMFNVYMDLDGPLRIDDDIIPYMMAGIGSSWNATSGDVGPLGGARAVFDEETETNLAWTVGGGLSYWFSETLAVDTRYRYMDLGQANWGNVPGYGAGMSADSLDLHEASIGLRYSF